jgi:hypothetical protein
VDARQGLSWLLVAMVAAVTAGAAALGVSQAPTTASLTDAIHNTLKASGYNEVATEQMQQGAGSETAYVTYQAPDRLGGYVEASGKRTYIYFIGQYEYRTLPLSPRASTRHLTLYRQAVPGGTSADPAHTYLVLATQGTDQRQSGNTTTMTLNQAGQTVSLSYTVSGQYISQFKGSGQGASVELLISQVGNAPPVNLPAGARVVNVPNG